MYITWQDKEQIENVYIICIQSGKWWVILPILKQI